MRCVRKRFQLTYINLRYKTYKKSLFYLLCAQTMRTFASSKGKKTRKDI